MLLLNDDLSDFARAIVCGEEPSSGIDTSYQNYSVAIAIEVYRNNYRGNLHEALAGAYPVIEQLVGKEFFRLLTRQFIGQHLSRSGNLHHYGAEMAGFIAAFDSVQGLPYLPDVATLEWACQCAYFADDAATLNLDKLAQVSPEQYPDLILHIHPACQLVRSRYPIATIWHAHQPGAPSDFKIDLDSGASNALISRKNDVVVVSALTEGDAVWLQSIQAGTPLGEAIATTLAHYPDFDLQAALLNLVAQNVFESFSLGALP
ncbi:MAG: DNA-binding domain-containing protein [Candidatus Nitrotoga sp.]|nr:DNA-binding domain-containing protein [Candidatus Nitrotoga sp.]MDO9448132.1 DNA-binding domain-containing protein [Candidatus Nitrotoga sp.]